MDFDMARDVGSADGARSVFSSAVIPVFSGSLSATASTSGARVSSDRRILGVSSDRASISTVTAVFTRSEERRVGKQCRSGWGADH